jgi:hypothetical protein
MKPKAQSTKLIGFHLIAFQLSAFNFQLKPYQLPTTNYYLSTTNYEVLASSKNKGINYQLRPQLEYL